MVEFRIATLCYILLNTKPGTRILFDDIIKPQYRTVIDQLPVKYTQISKMCEFISPEIKYPVLHEYIFKYEYNWR